VSLPKRWRELTRRTAARAPERWGVYEVGDASGTVVDAGYGVVRDELKTLLAYGGGDAERVRWETADSEAHARRLYEGL
jgi:hypothetical protein